MRENNWVLKNRSYHILLPSHLIYYIFSLTVILLPILAYADFDGSFVGDEACWSRKRDIAAIKPTFINMTSFNAIAKDNVIILTWVTGAELSTEGFNILRSESANGPFIQINPSLIPAKSALGGGTYSYSDGSIKEGERYYYRIEDVDIKGKRSSHNTISLIYLKLKGDPKITPVSNSETIKSVSRNVIPETSATYTFLYTSEDIKGNRLSLAKESSISTIPERMDDIETRLTLYAENGSVIIEWKSDEETYGFNILRSDEKDRGYTQINENLITYMDSAEANREIINYAYTDITGEKGKKYYYKLEMFREFKGRAIYFGPLPVTLANTEEKISKRGYSNEN